MSRHPQEILDEIGRTRGEMAGTLGAIRERLAPARMKAQGKRYLVTRGVPLVLALAGVALAVFVVLRIARADDD